jgi:hypothetical protein
MLECLQLDFLKILNIQSVPVRRPMHDMNAVLGYVPVTGTWTPRRGMS